MQIARDYIIITTVRLRLLHTVIKLLLLYYTPMFQLYYDDNDDDDNNNNILYVHGTTMVGGY
jgi:hypothetical protein